MWWGIQRSERFPNQDLNTRRFPNHLQLMERKTKIIIEKDTDGWFVASAPALPGFHTQARTLDELNERILEVASLWTDVDSKLLRSKFSNTLWLALSCVSLFVSVSCTTVKYPKPTAEELKMAQGFVPPKDKALIVAYRSPSAAPFARSVPTGVWIDGKPHGATKAGTFVVVPTAKGTHNVDLFCDSGDAEQSFKLKVSPGDVIFFRQHVENTTTGTMLVPSGGTQVQAPVAGMRIYATRVNDSVGRKEVSQCVQSGNSGKVSVSTWP